MRIYTRAGSLIDSQKTTSTCLSKYLSHWCQNLSNTWPWFQANLRHVWHCRSWMQSCIGAQVRIRRRGSPSSPSWHMHTLCDRGFESKGCFCSWKDLKSSCSCVQIQVEQSIGTIGGYAPDVWKTHWNHRSAWCSIGRVWSVNEQVGWQPQGFHAVSQEEVRDVQKWQHWVESQHQDVLG